MKTDQEINSILLSIIESMIDRDIDVGKEELDYYLIAAITAHKKYGRVCPHVKTVVDMREGISIHDLVSAGLSYEDYRATYHYKQSA